ncbi:hypothetical protein FHG87_001798 [Trinorchestia longiramus]|nr:hypothetical protein FHG87_001798 [Trinorchestia longiramus]
MSGGLSSVAAAAGAAKEAAGSDTMIQRLQKAMELEETDRDTLHLLVFLFMQFLAQPQHAGGIEEEKGGVKSIDAVLRHVAGLMGYSTIESNFSVGPTKLRASPVFNSFIANLPQVLDHNFQMAKKIIAIIVPVLQFSPAPHKVPDLRQPTYSLWMLQPTIRKAWLTSTLTILYKFDCEESYLKGQVISLVLITLNSLDRHFHRCRVDQTPAVASSLHYPRDMSVGSLGGDMEAGEDGGDRSSPAGGPMAGEATPPPPAGGDGGQEQVDVPEVLLTQVFPDDEPCPPAVAAIITEEDGCAKVQLSASPPSRVMEDPSGQEIWYDAESVKMIGEESTSVTVARASRTGDVQLAVAREVLTQLPVVRESATAVTSVMASQIQAFDDSFTVKIHNAELADDDDSGLQRLSEQALQGLRSRFAASTCDSSQHSSAPSTTASSVSSPSNAGSQLAHERDATQSSLKDALGRRALAQSHVSSSTPKSSGSSQRSSTSYWLSSSTSTDSSSDFNVSRAATKLAFEICIEEDPETWEASDDSKNHSVDLPERTRVNPKEGADVQPGYYSEESGIEATVCSSTELNGALQDVTTPWSDQPPLSSANLTNFRVATAQVLDVDFTVLQNSQKLVDAAAIGVSSTAVTKMAPKSSTGKPPPAAVPPVDTSSSGGLSHPLLSTCSPPSPLSMMDLITVERELQELQKLLKLLELLEQLELLELLEQLPLLLLLPLLRLLLLRFSVCTDCSTNITSSTSNVVAGSPVAINCSTNITSSTSNVVAGFPVAINCSTNITSSTSNVVAGFPVAINCSTNITSSTSNVVAGSPVAIDCSTNITSFTSNVVAGSPVAIDCSTSSPSIDLPSPKLEIPLQERLLDGGESAVDNTEKQPSIIDRVWQAFGGWTSTDKSCNGDTTELHQVVSDGQKPEKSSPESPMSAEKETMPTSPQRTVERQPEIHGKAVMPYLGKAKTTVVNYRVSLDGTDVDTKKNVSSVIESVNIGASKSGASALATRQAEAGQPSAGRSGKASELIAVEDRDLGVKKVAPGTKVNPKRGYNGNVSIPYVVTAAGSVEGAPTNRDGSKNSDADSESNGPPPASIKQSSMRVGEDCMMHRCLECGEGTEEFSNDDLGLCTIVLSTFVHRNPALAAPLLPRMLHTVARVSSLELYSWQYTSNVHLPGSATSIAGQFLRCVLHQLAPNQIFYQIFITKIDERNREKLFRTLAKSLADFNELNSTAPVQSLLSNLNDRKELPADTITLAISNLACYMECAFQDVAPAPGTFPFGLFETFMRKLIDVFDILEDVNPLLRLICAFFRIPGISVHKNILEPVSKAVVFGLRKAPVKYSLVADLAILCTKTFQKERDKLFLARMMALELIQALKFKVTLPDTNLVLLVQLMLQDNGGSIGPNPVLDLSTSTPATDPFSPQSSTLMAECIRTSYISDLMDFIADVHTLTKIKSGLNQDTIGGLLKAGMAQYLALEVSRGPARDTRFFNKYLPWLNNPPTAMQQGQKEFLDCVSHIRLLSWLLVGSLMHTCNQTATTTGTPACVPVPPDASCHIADHIQVILSGFPEQSKASVINMSSLFLAFILSQVWTVYLEQNAGSPGSDVYNSTCALLTDFWAKVTPSILQLVSHSKVLGEMVSLHFLALLEALQECGSTVLTRLLPLWAPLLHSPHQAKLPDQLAVRLQTCQDAIPLLPAVTHTMEQQRPPLNNSPLSSSSVLPSLLVWLKRLQFKMGQIELQSSAATQFYSIYPQLGVLDYSGTLSLEYWTAQTSSTRSIGLLSGIIAAERDVIFVYKHQLEVRSIIRISTPVNLHDGCS